MEFWKSQKTDTQSIGLIINRIEQMITNKVIINDERLLNGGNNKSFKNQLIIEGKNIKKKTDKRSYKKYHIS